MVQPMRSHRSVHRLLRLLVALVALLVSAVAAPGVALAAQPRPLILGFEGNARPLPNHILGGSVEALIEHILDNPAVVAALVKTAPAVVRFPGGSQSNYYDWRTGLLNIPVQPNSSSYMKFWANVAPKIAQAFPNGVKLELYAPLAQKIGADIILVPNLETSTTDEQVAWFKQLALENIRAQNIELGNEFWIAMGGDPAVMRNWPDEPTAMTVMQQYETALRPIVGTGGKFAIQSAGSAFNTPPDTRRPFQRRQLDWDAALAPAPWFDAVTVHLYPNPEEMVATTPGATLQQQFDRYMAHGDAGVDRVLNDVAKRVPGKEIWITEWSPRGGNPGDITNPNFHELVPPPMRAQLVARYELAYLRHPAVTKALYFTLNFTNKSIFQEYVQTADGSYAAMAPAVVLDWFDDAANGGSTFRRVIEAQGAFLSGIGPFKEGYRPIEGGLFQIDKRTVLLLQNGSAEARLYDPSQGGTKPWPVEADLLVSSDLMVQDHVAAQVTTLTPNQPILLPPYSLLRLIWK